MYANTAIWTISGVTTAGIILRPLALPEWIWALAGAFVLLAAQLITPGAAWAGIEQGADVYLFLIGMMLLSEVARVEGLFDWLAAWATQQADGSARGLFLLTYVVGTVVTIFLSNDATAVVLTPAVAAAVRTARVKDPIPFLLICAFIANAASFVLPISNPANLVIYGKAMPPLPDWLPRYLLPSIVSIVATYFLLAWSQRKRLAQKVSSDTSTPHLKASAKLAAAGIALTALVLMGASTFDMQLGAPTAVAGAITTLLVLGFERKNPWPIMKDISWGVLPLVAGLFILVEALRQTGLLGSIAELLHRLAGQSVTGTAWGAAIAVAVGSNLANNLPVGLVAGTAVQTAGLSDHIAKAVLIGVDIGPNLSITGSLATILWLTALRREGHDIGAAMFLKIGAVVMLPTLLLALAAAEFTG